MYNKCLSLIKLARVTAPAAYLLYFFPACYGLGLATGNLTDLKLLSFFFVGSVITRSAGCIINDIFDREFDCQVARTKDRPLANKSVSLNNALIMLAMMLIAGLIILLTLSRTAIYLGFLAFFLMIAYPLMKRITYLPQVFLGFTINMGALIAYASVADQLSLKALLVYLACCFWTIGYDTIYGFMDVIDDKKVGVKSLAILLEKNNYRNWLYFFYVVFIVLFTLAFLSNTSLFCRQGIAIVIAGIMLIWQVKTLNINDSHNCFVRFKNNNYVGAILLLPFLLS